MAFEDILFGQGQDNMAGLIGDLYFAPLDDIDLTALPAIGADLVVTGNITLKALKKFFRLYNTRGNGKITSNVVGERDGRSFENIFEYKFPGDTKEVISFLRQVSNTPGVLIGKTPQGVYRLLGLSVVKDTDGVTDVTTFDLPAYLETAAGDSGAAGADAKGHTISFKSEALCPPLIYTGTVDLDAGT